MNGEAKILLTSFGFNSPIVREKVKKTGLLQNAEEKICFVLPYAGYNADSAFEYEKRGLAEFGFLPEGIIYVKGREDFEGCVPDCIYVSGGDPFKLLKTLREKELVECVTDCVRKQKSIYVGISAGADLTVENMEYVRLLGDNNEIKDNSFEALNIFPFTVVCHREHRDYSTVLECERISGKDAVTIEDAQVVLSDGTDWEYVE